jgi:hypothetical protein
MQQGIRDVTDYNSSRPERLIKFKEFLESSAPDPGKSHKRQKCSRSVRVNSPKAEVFPARKSKLSLGRGIPGQEE